MTQHEINGMWNYFLTLENDLDTTSRYIEPAGQESVYSFEFAKILILACTEIEAVFKAICFEIEHKQVPGDIGTYKSTILSKYPKIVNTTVTISRLGRNIEPFVGWDLGKLFWWDAYQHVKHNRGGYFSEATYISAATALSALYVLIFYLAKITGISFRNTNSKYIDSDYSDPILICDPFASLPDFE